MKVKFVSTSNNLAQLIVGQTVKLSYDDVAYFSFDPELIEIGKRFDYRRGEWRTSLLTNIKFEETSRFCYIITVSTRNSEYVFQKGEKTDESPLTEKEILALQMAVMF